MDAFGAKAEALFGQAIEVPHGEARDSFLAKACADQPDLRREVESLLRAHDQASGFLQTASPSVGARADSTSAHEQTAVLNPAAQAEVFLRGVTEPGPGELETFLGALPEEIRRETRERIQAGLRVRRCRSELRSVSPDAGVTPPSLPGYRIERKLGAGGLGVVYAAHDEKLNRRVAIKMLRHQPEEPVQRRILQEARHAASFSDPSAVTIFSVLDEANPPAIVMELVEGFPIDRFAEHLDFQQKARLLREVARALAVAHQRGLIHRDLKPDNVLVGPDLRPRLLDFGLALTLEEASRQGRGFEGTPLYASPEQVLGRPLTAATDVFSLGGLMFKVLTGRTPFEGETLSAVMEAVATTSPPFLREVALGVPEDLQAICLACLAWDAADRPSANDVALELGRFLLGEPVRLRPKLYTDMLRRSISQYSTQAQSWACQSIISSDERDSLEVVHRRLLADEDHWIIDARRITPLQTILFGGTWLAVVATVLMVWMLPEDLGPPWRWLLPVGFTSTLLVAGQLSLRARESVAAASFLAGAALAIAPCILALLAELSLLDVPVEGVMQLFPDTFTNQQVFAASLTALAVSAFALNRLKMTGFAWTTATLTAASYLGLLLLFDWLERDPEIQALWCLPLAALELVALRLEKQGRVRWTLPFHLVALAALVIGLDLMAIHGPTLNMIGLKTSSYLDAERQAAFSFVLNGLIFLALFLLTEHSASLDLRRAGRFLEVLAIFHILSSLFANALGHRQDPYLRLDVALYLIAAVGFSILAPFRSRWRLLVGGLAGCGLGSYLLVDLGLVDRKPFIITLGLVGLCVAFGSFAYVRRAQRPAVRPRPDRTRE